MKNKSHSYPVSSQLVLWVNSGHVGSQSSTFGSACCQRSAAVGALPWCCLGVGVLTPLTWKAKQCKLNIAVLSLWRLCYDARPGLSAVLTWVGLKVLFKFAKKRNAHSKPTARIKEKVSSVRRLCTLMHIYGRHDNFIEACDVVCQIWAG